MRIHVEMILETESGIPNAQIMEGIAEGLDTFVRKGFPLASCGPEGDEVTIASYRFKGGEKVEHHEDEDAEMTGWFIVYYDNDGTSFDSVGPYESEEEAKRIQKETGGIDADMEAKWVCRNAERAKK